MEFYDIGDLSSQEKEALLLDRYGKKLRHAGNKHPVVDRIRSLNKNSRPNPERLAVMGGIWAMSLALKYQVEIKYLMICPAQLKSIESQRLVDAFVDRAQETYLVSQRVFDIISETENGQGILGVLKLDYTAWQELLAKDPSLLLILDGLEIPGNVGTILRSAEATGFEGVILTNRKVRLNHPKLLRSSMGSVFKVPMAEAEDTPLLLSSLKERGYSLLLADTAGGKAYHELGYGGKIALVMGSEKYGISQDFYDLPNQPVMIPMLGDMDSLNVGVAATILMYEAALKNKGLMRR